MSVTVVSCVYGTTHWKFANRWRSAISRMDPYPDAIIVASDTTMRRAVTVNAVCTWRHPQAFYLNKAIELARTEWVWICDIDDIAHPWALKGLDEVEADVWQMGYNRDSGESLTIYLPPQLTNAEYLSSERNVYVAGSAIRVKAFREIGGFRDVALQDWDLWIRLAEAGASFESSGRTHFDYMRHPDARGEVDTTFGYREEHLAEMRARAVA